MRLSLELWTFRSQFCEAKCICPGNIQCKHFKTPTYKNLTDLLWKSLFETLGSMLHGMKFINPLFSQKFNGLCVKTWINGSEPISSAGSSYWLH